MNQKKKIFLLIILCVTTLVTGMFLIKTGVQTISKTQTKLQNEKNSNNIKEFEKELIILTEEENELKIELNNEFQTNGNSEKYTEIENKLKEISEDKTEIEFEISKTKNGYYDNQSGINESITSGLVYIIPGILLCIGTFMLVIVTIKKISE
jgi:isocitrate lyase